MTVGLVKLITERRYVNAYDMKPDVRVFHVPHEHKEAITSWYKDRGWEVTAEAI